MIFAALSSQNSDNKQQSLSKFYEDNKDRLYAIAYNALQNAELAEDAVQETFARIIKSYDDFERADQNKKITFAIVVIKGVIPQIAGERDEYEELCDDVPDSRISLDEELIGKISEKELLDYIKTMPESRKQALILKIVYDLSFQEMGEALGISESAARRRIAESYGEIIRFVKRGKQ